MFKIESYYLRSLLTVTGEISGMIPRVVIAGTHSGCGKTTVATGIMSALTSTGLTVQPFKVGPDFIDPSHHTRICGRQSRNLCPFMMGEGGVLKTFFNASEGADIAVIEGVMGMYDGLDGSDTASTAHVARILSAPIILVVDAKGSSRSANAVVKGFSSYDRSVDIAGTIFNHIGSERHAMMIREGLEKPVLGFLPTKKDGIVESRHLGLKMSHETDQFSAFGKFIAEHCDLDAISGIALSATDIHLNVSTLPAIEKKVIVAVASDEAFCFVYQDNLDLLVSKGAELVFFSPIKDTLPEADMLYLPGGYPELYAKELSASPCKNEIKKRAESGMPVYGECGGLVYLTRGIETNDGYYDFSGILPAEAIQKERFQALGYVDATFASDNGIFDKGTHFRGHEFHYSVVEPDRDARFSIRLKRGKGISDGLDGLNEYRTVAGYSHAYFSDKFAESMVSAAERYRLE